MTRDMSDIIELPELTNDLMFRLWNIYAETDGIAGVPIGAAITAYLDAAVRWQDIDPSDIKPGMRVRRTEQHIVGFTAIRIGVVKTVDVSDASDASDAHGTVRFVGGAALRTTGEWQVDPRTIPTDPDQAILDLLAEWISVDDAPLVLSDLREIANVVPLALSDLRKVADIAPKAVES